MALLFLPIELHFPDRNWCNNLWFCPIERSVHRLLFRVYIYRPGIPARLYEDRTSPTGSLLGLRESMGVRLHRLVCFARLSDSSRYNYPSVILVHFLLWPDTKDHNTLEAYFDGRLHFYFQPRRLLLTHVKRWCQHRPELIRTDVEHLDGSDFPLPRTQLDIPPYKAHGAQPSWGAAPEYPPPITHTGNWMCCRSYDCMRFLLDYDGFHCKWSYMGSQHQAQMPGLLFKALRYDRQVLSWVHPGQLWADRLPGRSVLRNCLPARLLLR